MNNNLQQAIDCLRISDLYVRNLHAECSEGFDPKHSDETELVIQTKHMVVKSEILQNDNEEKLFRVFVDVGVKWLAKEAINDETNKEALAQIEAEFIAEYVLSDDLKSECLEEFALKNVSYHVWPYWRELLTSQCEKMRLPRLLLPMTQIAQNQNLVDDK